MISLFHDSSTPSENSLLYPKVSSPFKLRNTMQLFPRQFFEGISIFLQIQDENVYKKAKNALESVGAIIMTEIPYMADYIVSEKPITIPIIRQQRTRGSRLVALASGNQGNDINSNPKTILVKQIPWIFSNQEENKGEIIDLNQKNQIINSSRDENYDPDLVVVANGREAPIFIKMKQFPTLHFESVPKGYNITPFSPVRKDATLLVEMQKNHTPKAKSPPEIPKKSIKKDWREFDSICDSLNERFFSSIC